MLNKVQFVSETFASTIYSALVCIVSKFHVYKKLEHFEAESVE